jgi:uncharacterized protein YbbK (DUF523 family)
MAIPRVGVSACLLGQEVRYDGSHKRSATLIELIGTRVELVPVCPEVEVGMGTPREPLELVRDARGLRMITVQTGIDYTDRMNEWARQRVRELERAGIDGYVLKSGSPSCGLDPRGLFAGVLTTTIPTLPVIDEKQLEDPAARSEFIDRVIAYHRECTVRSDATTRERNEVSETRTTK